jgi:hypothetical protein
MININTEKKKNLTEAEKDTIVAMRKRSGEVRIESRLVSFLYELMRDHVPLGVVEEIVQASEKEPDVLYTNGWLAKYAEDIANRLK